MSSLSLPTDRTDWRVVGRTVRHVLGQPLWLLVACVLTVGIVTVFVVVDAPIYVRTVVLGSDVSVSNRVRALGALFPLVGSSGTPLRGILSYMTAAAIGTNLTVLGHHLRHGLVGIGNTSGGLGGVVVGTLGAGCAPCGAAIFAGVASASSVATGLAVLPLQGAEFLLVALLMSVLSLFWIAAGVRHGDVDGCPVDC